MYQSIATIKGDLAQAEFGVSGRGIVWAILGTGIDAKHPHFLTYRNLELPKGLCHMDFSSAIPLKGKMEIFRGDPVDYLKFGKKITKSIDTHGAGTWVAGIIAGQSTDEAGRTLKGLAPEAKIISFKVLNDGGEGDEVCILAALRAIQQINDDGQALQIHGVIVPISLPWDRENYACGHSPVCVDVNRLVNSGVVVVTAAGNRGSIKDDQPYAVGEITDPGNADLAITVGATHRTSPQIYGVSYFSSRGPTSDGRSKPDLLAPGEKVVVCNTSAKGGGYERHDGTLIAAAHVAGAAAALLSIQASLTGMPGEVKSILLRTAVDLGREVKYQGAGLLDVLAACRMAKGTSNSKSSANTPVKIFCSYSHSDKALWIELKAHLSPLERAGRIKLWSDHSILAGEIWEDEIYQNLDAADIVLILVSAFFIASDFCYANEFTRSLEKHAKGQTRIVPIKVRPVTLTGTAFEKIQMLPAEAEPITSFKDPHEGWAKVTEQLSEIVLLVKRDKNIDA